MAKSEVATTGDAVAKRPDWMKKGQGRGGINVDASKIELPRLMLMQGISPLVMDGKANQGELYHNIAEEVIGKNLRIAVIMVKYNFVLWPPRTGGESNRTFLARADDGVHWEPANEKFEVTLKGGKKVTWTTADTVAASGLAEWGSSDPSEENSPPAATETQNIFCVSPDRPDLGPFVIMLQRVFLSAGRKLNSKLNLSDDDYWARYIDISTFVDTTKKGEKFYQWQFKLGDFVQSQEEYERYEGLFNRFKKLNVTVRGEDAVDQEFENPDTDDEEDDNPEQVGEEEY